MPDESRFELGRVHRRLKVFIGQGRDLPEASSRFLDCWVEQAPKAPFEIS